MSKKRLHTNNMSSLSTGSQSVHREAKRKPEDLAKISPRRTKSHTLTPPKEFYNSYEARSPTYSERIPYSPKTPPIKEDVKA